MTHEMHNALADRLDVERKWADFIRMYDAPRRGSSDFPFPGASNEEMPLIAMHVEPVLAQFMQSIHAPRDIWTAVDLSGDFTDSVNAVTEFMTVIDRLFINMRAVNQRAFPDLVVLGTCAYKVDWLFEKKKVKAYNDEGEIITDTKIRNQPFVHHIPLGDFIWPANAWDIDPDAPVAPAAWVARRLKLSENQLRARGEGQEPFLPNYDKPRLKDVLARETEEEETVEGAIRESDELRPSFDRKIPIFEVEARFDVDGDGIDEDIIVTWYQKGGWILRAIHNPWLHGKRSFEVQQYMQTFSILGKGVAEMTESMQAIATKLLNAQVDNVLLANTRMWAMPQGSLISPDEPIYPNKMWMLQPGEDIQSLQMGEVYPSIFQLMAQVQQMSETRTSVSELRQGDISALPSRTPATTVLSLLQEGNKKFDMILGNLRMGALAHIGKRIFQMIAQRHQQGDKQWARLATDMLGEDDGRKVIEVLELPVSVLETGLGIEVTATSGQVNKEVQKQSMVALAQFLAQAYPQMVQAATIMGDNKLAAAASVATYNGGVEVLRRLLEAFEIQNPERYLPPPAGEETQQAAQQQLDIQSQLGGPLGPQGGGGTGGQPLGAVLGLG